MEMMPARFVGQSVGRLEDLPLITGNGRFVADIDFPHQLQMRLVRSSNAHGRLNSVEVDRALNIPGVAAVWTWRDTIELPPIDFREGSIERFAPYRQPVLARDYVRYVGEPVAAVFAEDPYLAEDAASEVELTVEELPVLLDASQEPAEFENGLSTEVEVLKKSFGDIDAAFASAQHIVELELKVGRHSGVPMETRGALARFDPVRDVLEMYGAAKVPHKTRDLLAKTLGRSPSSVHLIEGHTGGGFGIRGELYPEDVLVCFAALQFGRPVKWIEDRREHLMAANHSREQMHRIQAAVDKDGVLLGIDSRFYHSQGAYIRTHGSRVVDMTAGTLPGPYRLPAYRVAGHFRLTNKTPAATYRSPGRYESTFVRERLMDAIAHRLNLDPIEVRRANLIAKEEMPFERPTDTLGESIVYDSGDYAKLLDKTLAALNWENLKKELAGRRASGEAIGFGLAMFVEKSGLGPADGVRVTVHDDGSVDVLTGGASLGQGFETVMAQICADELGVDYRRIKVMHGRTDMIAHGVGAHSSRATVLTGSAVHVAANKVRQKALAVASEMMQTPMDELGIVDGVIERRGVAPSPSMSLAEVAKVLAPTSRSRGDREPGLSSEGWFFTEHMVFPYGVHVAVVRIDSETAGITVDRYLVGYDVGRAVNPAMIEGQIAGGMAQGIGGALLEEFCYDEGGQPVSVTFADYLLPTAREIPALQLLLTEDAPSPCNPLGLKGAGEGGSNGAGAAIAAAIDNAIGIPLAVTELPVTPQRLRALLKRSKEVRKPARTRAAPMEIEA